MEAQTQPARHPTPTTKACALAYLIFERSDLELAEDFLTDFGLLLASREHDTVYFRGTSDVPYIYRVHRAERSRFVGAGFVMPERADLERLARLDGASAIAPAHHPGGGEHVVLRDPSGFVVEAIHGQCAAREVPTREPMAFNSGGTSARVNKTQRPPIAPPDVLRLGHLVLEVADFQATCGWYTQHLGLLPSDVQILADGSPAVVFLRLDRGMTPSDHHTLAMAQSFMPRYGHSAYEVVDADAVGMGERVLRDKRRYRHAWGIGRHILGSQIFDYWEDPWREKHEHYCDGDLFTADRPMGTHPVSREAMSQWGPPMPSSFTKPQPSPAAIVSLLRNLRRSPDVTLAKLKALTKVFG